MGIKRKIGETLDVALAPFHAVVNYYSSPERAMVVDLARRIKKEREMILRDEEAYNIFALAKRTSKLQGVLAEVGAYKRGSSALICEAKGAREFHVFDTFEGLPQPGQHDPSFVQGQMAGRFEDVRDYLKKYPNTHVHKGLFPDSAKPVEEKRFAFVHLDVDLYESTINSLRFFYPRMTKGGVILSHDYNLPGVRKAFDEFFADKREIEIELPGSHGMVVKD